MATTDTTVAPVRDVPDLGEARGLFRAYAGAIDFDLAYQGFEGELAALPGVYAPPRGVLLLARDRRGRAVGCAGVRPHAIEGACELKRLYVLPAARGTGAGGALMRAALGFAGVTGYRQMRLDTLPTMREAAVLYRRLGFEPVPAPPEDAGLGQLYFARALARG